MTPQLTRASWLAGASAFTAAAAGAWNRADAQGLMAVSAGAGLIEALGEAYYAVDQGMFRKHGLDVQIQSFQSGAAVAAGVAGGAIQFGVSNTLQLAQAHARNVPFKIVAYGSLTNDRYPVSALMVTLAGGIASPKELNGKTIGIATLRGLDQLAASALIDKHGGDSKTVQFVEISPPALLPALLQGRVAAGTFGPPQLQQALDTKLVKTFGDIMAVFAPLWVATNWFSTSDFLQKNADVAHRFAAAIYEAGTWATADRSAAAAVLDRVLKTTGSRTYLTWASSASPTYAATMQPVLDVATRYGYVESTKAADLLWSGI